MAVPIKNTDHVAEALRRLLFQFRNKLVIEGEVGVVATQLQELENVFFDLLLLRWLDTASGVQLDGLGKIVGELRHGRNDTDYTAALNARIRINRMHSRMEEMILVATLTLNRNYTFTEFDPHTLIANLDGALLPTDPSADIIALNLFEAKGAGIAFAFIYSEYDDANTFIWSDGNFVQADADRGWADDALTQGGYLADVSG